MAENTRQVVQRFMDNIAPLKLREAFGMFAEDGTWTIDYFWQIEEAA